MAGGVADEAEHPPPGLERCDGDGPAVVSDEPNGLRLLQEDLALHPSACDPDKHKGATLDLQPADGGLPCRSLGITHSDPVTGRQVSEIGTAAVDARPTAALERVDLG